MSRRNGLLEELDDLERQSSALRLKHDSAMLDLELLLAHHYVVDHRSEFLPDLVKRTPEDALSQLLSLRPEGISERALELEGKSLIDSIQSEREWLNEKLKEASYFPKYFWDWYRENDIDIDDRYYSVLDAIHDHLCAKNRLPKKDIDS